MIFHNRSTISTISAREIVYIALPNGMFHHLKQTVLQCNKAHIAEQKNTFRASKNVNS